MNNKYNVGDLVVFGDQVGKVKKVIKNYYLDTNSPYYMYDIAIGHYLFNVPEPALSPLIASEADVTDALRYMVADFAEPTIAKPQKEVKCECGAYQIHWMQGQHAPYCPLGVSYV